MTKQEITIHSDGYRSYPAVNVKINWFASRDLPRTLEQVRHQEDIDPRFTESWIDGLTDAQRDRCWEWAISDAWEQLENDVNAENVFGRSVTVHSIGRSGGWAIVKGLRADDVPLWDAIKVSQWAKFARFARETADDVPYQYVRLLYLHEFEPWAKQQSIIQSFCEEL